MACLGIKCYKRSDINYIAQGMYAARVGESKGDAEWDAEQWKARRYGEPLSEDTKYWVDYGWHQYQALDKSLGGNN